MPTNTEKFQKLPYFVREHITSEEALTANDKIIAAFNLDKPKKQVLFGLLRDTILKNIFLDQFFQKLQSSNLVPQNQVQNLALEVAKNRFLPLEKWLGVNVNNYIENWQKGNYTYREEPKIYLEPEETESETETPASTFGAKAIQAPALTDLNQITQNIIKASNLNLTDPVLRKRFENLVTSFLKEIRNLTQVQETLERPTKIGGLGLAKDQTLAIIKLLKLEKAKFEESKKIKGPEPKTGLDRLISAESAASFIVKRPANLPAEVTQEETKAGENQKTILRRGSGQEKQENGSMIHDAGNMTQETIQSFSHSIIQSSTTNPAVPKLQPVTISYHKLSTISRSSKSEGRPPVINDLPKLKRRETTSYQEPEHISPPKNLPRVAPAIPQRPAAPKIISMQEIKPPVNKFNGSTLRPGSGLTTGKLIKAEGAINQPTSSFTSFPRRNVAGLSDIKQPPGRLIGEIEELASLRLVDFRRWSNDPHESAARIRDKIEAIEKESLIKKAAAINSWHGSEIYRFYLDIGRESMETGQSVDIIIRARQAENRPTLSLAEFEAVADLNRELNF